MKEFLNYELIKLGEWTLSISNIGGAVVVIVATLIVLLLMRRVITRKGGKEGNEYKRRHSIYLLLKYVIWVIAIVIILETLGIEVKLLLAGSAALLVGIGLGLQNIFADLISGLFLLFEGTIKVGEILETDGIVGKVQEINLRNSKLHTRENVTIIVPNSKFVTSSVINWSHDHDAIRFVVDVGVAYGSDVDKVSDCLNLAMTKMVLIEQTPKPFVRLKNFGDSSLDFELIFWTQEAFGVDNLRSDLRKEIYRQLHANDITIPFPQRDLHIVSDKTKANS